MIDWYTFNVATLLLLLSLAAFNLFALFIVIEERKELKREPEQWRKQKLGQKL